MARINYQHGYYPRPVAANVPPGELTDIRMGQIIEVYDVYQRAAVRTGEVVHFIEAGATPDFVAMEILFRANKAAEGTSLKQYSVPTRPSKYRRLIIRNRGGRCFAFNINPDTHRFYPGSTRSER